VVGIVADTGGIEYARQRGEQFAHDAEEALRVIPESSVRTSLTDAIAYVMERRS
jgi:geranylgeranyl pyrophosphate synthase